MKLIFCNQLPLLKGDGFSFILCFIKSNFFYRLILNSKLVFGCVQQMLLNNPLGKNWWVRSCLRWEGLGNSCTHFILNIYSKTGGSKVFNGQQQDTNNDCNSYLNSHQRTIPQGQHTCTNFFADNNGKKRNTGGGIKHTNFLTPRKKKTTQASCKEKGGN